MQSLQLQRVDTSSGQSYRNCSIEYVTQKAASHMINNTKSTLRCSQRLRGRAVERRRWGDKLGQLLKLEPALGICHWICFQSFLWRFFRSLWALPAQLFAIIKPTMIFLLCCPFALHFDLLGIHVISTHPPPLSAHPLCLHASPSVLPWCESYVKSFDLFSTFISQSISNLGRKIQTAFRN